MIRSVTLQFIRRWGRWGRVISILVLVCATGPVGPVLATGYLVTGTGDGDTTNGDCTLREALYAATHNTVRDACPAGSAAVEDVITIDTSSAINFDGGQFVLNVQGGPLRIRGATRDRGDSVIGLAFSSRFLYLFGADPVTLEDLTVYFGDEGSDTVSWGGVIRATSTSLTLRNVELSLSQARLGGAVYFATQTGSHRLTVEDSVFLGNHVEGSDAGGGGLWVDVDADTSVSIVDTTFSGNSVTMSNLGSGYGGGARVKAAGGSTVTVARTTFTDNEVSGDRFNAAGLALDLSGTAQATVRDCAFTGNTTEVPSLTGYTQYPGLHVLADGSVRVAVDRCTFTGNRCSNEDGSRQVAVYAKTGTEAVLSNLLIVGGHWGAFGFADGDSQTTFANITVTENDRSVWLTTGAGGDSRLYNSMCADNGLDLIVVDGSSQTSMVYTGTTPLFVDPASGDYRLQAGSPGFDAGSQALAGTGFCDLDHAPRVVGAEVDLGAYERDGLFADDLEAGDMGAWSAVVE